MFHRLLSFTILETAISISVKSIILHVLTNTGSVGMCTWVCVAFGELPSMIFSHAKATGFEWVEHMDLYAKSTGALTYEFVYLPRKQGLLGHLMRRK